MLYKSFLEMEEKFRLFELKDDGIPYLWDIVRMNTYKAYYTKGVDDSLFISNKQKGVNDVFHRIVSVVKSSCYFLTHLRAKYIIAPHSRYLKDGVYYDKICTSVIEDLKNEILVVEDHSYRNKYSYGGFFPYLVERYFIHKFQNYCISDKSFEHIEKALKDAFGEVLVDKKYLNRLVRGYLVQREFYDYIFSITSCSTFFYVLSGSQKGAIEAAKKHNIVCYELQHGAFENDHPAYSYPPFITKESKNIIMPDFLLTFGSYWGTNVNFPVKGIKVIGNDEYVYAGTKLDLQDFVVVISNGLHKDILIPATKILADSFPLLTFIYKLHPGEFSAKDHYINQLKECANVRVYSTEYDIRDLLCASSLVLLAATTVMSTCLYESLNYKKKVVVVKPYEDEGPDFLYNCPNVFLSDGEDYVSTVQIALQNDENSLSLSYFVKYKGIKAVLNEK